MKYVHVEDGKTYLTRKSVMSGSVSTMEIPDTTPMQLMAYYNNPNALIQQSFPYLSEDIREFILSGVTPQEWSDVFDADYDE